MRAEQTAVVEKLFQSLCGLLGDNLFGPDVLMSCYPETHLYGAGCLKGSLC
jgi:hypothetical protein